jgi:hypothetical protein
VVWGGRYLTPAGYRGKQVPAAERNGPFLTNNKLYEKLPWRRFSPPPSIIKIAVALIKGLPSLLSDHNDPNNATSPETVWWIFPSEDTLYEKLVVTDWKNHLLCLEYEYKNFVWNRLSLVLLVKFYEVTLKWKQ